VFLLRFRLGRLKIMMEFLRSHLKGRTLTFKQRRQWAGQESQAACRYGGTEQFWHPAGMKVVVWIEIKSNSPAPE